LSHRTSNSPQLTNRVAPAKSHQKIRRKGYACETLLIWKRPVGHCLAQPLPGAWGRGLARRSHWHPPFQWKGPLLWASSHCLIFLARISQPLPFQKPFRQPHQQAWNYFTQDSAWLINSGFSLHITHTLLTLPTEQGHNCCKLEHSHLLPWTVWVCTSWKHSSICDLSDWAQNTKTNGSFRRRGGGPWVFSVQDNFFHATHNEPSTSTARNSNPYQLQNEQNWDVLGCSLHLLPPDFWTGRRARSLLLRVGRVIWNQSLAKSKSVESRVNEFPWQVYDV